MELHAHTQRRPACPAPEGSHRRTAASHVGRKSAKDIRAAEHVLREMRFARANRSQPDSSCQLVLVANICYKQTYSRDICYSEFPLFVTVRRFASQVVSTGRK